MIWGAEMVVTVDCEDERDDTDTDDDAEDVVSGVVANKHVHRMIGGLDRDRRLWGGR